MATSTTQAQLGDYPSPDYSRGDLLRDHGTGRTSKLSLVECPLCRSDPRRPRYHFQHGESRARHFQHAH